MILVLQTYNKEWSFWILLFMKRNCCEIGKYLVLHPVFLEVFGFDVNGRKMLTEIQNTRNAARCTNER